MEADNNNGTLDLLEENNIANSIEEEVVNNDLESSEENTLGTVNNSNISFDLEISIDNSEELEEFTDFGGINTEDVSLAEDSEDTILFINQEENSDILEPINNEFTELANDLSNEKDSDIETFTPTNYSVFNFEPETRKPFSDVDLDSITKNLLDLANKNPEVDIIKIYNMKYKDNETIQKIAIELKISEDKVVEILKEIISVL